MRDVESELRRFRLRGPRPELKELILARVAETERRLPRRRWPWVETTAAACFLSAFAINAVVARDSERRLDRVLGPRPALSGSRGEALVSRGPLAFGSLRAFESSFASE